MIASLAWYPAAAPAWEALWDGIRARLPDDLDGVPERLIWPQDFRAHWRDRNLLLSMTCALPMKLGLDRHVHVVGAPAWDVPDLPALPRGHYCSHIVTRADETRPLGVAARGGLAVNAGDSQSGWGTLVAAGLDGPRLLTGSHAASMAAVAEGRADLAAIDVVTWAIAPHPDLRVRVTTPPTPATPFVTARADLVGVLRDAIAGAIRAQSREDRIASRLRGIEAMPDDAYRAELQRDVSGVPSVRG
ncbi:hypothetical protein JSE7799_00442 [Jannaschia seosinensis]|uniref:Phosphate/phosphite/phosphonate ABC transporters, periplasmic binding protein n=1 Tax=Jannaschia seosinensis TaxID=313367 RepID=A0A0M7B4K7_9RHOB|nr:PhnD/SsuA/transferrin family substrate-binding protein [Jannaschia seosinensis]CUH18550.1 hypothetical protein JSE7799_00442 [Jannaschia seosinensis]